MKIQFKKESNVKITIGVYCIDYVINYGRIFQLDIWECGKRMDTEYFAGH
jgi:hypothetical protein